MEIRSAIISIRAIQRVVHNCELRTLAATVASPAANRFHRAAWSSSSLHHPRLFSTRQSPPCQCVPTLGCCVRSAFPTRTFGPFCWCGVAGQLWSPVSSVGAVRSMAGHSKWANIRHIKAAKDHEKSRIITDFTRKIRAFIRETGQVDPKYSSQLAKMIADAKAKNVPGATIDRVLSQMSSLKKSSPIVFEAKGPSGSVMLIEAISVKTSHTRAELQNLVKKCGFSLFEGGSLARMVFDEKGVVLVSITGDTIPNLDDYVEVAIEAGAEDVTLEEDEDGVKVLQFLCEPSDVYAVKKELEARQLPVRSAEVVFLSTSTVPMDSSSLEQMAKVLEKLEEHPDVLKVYTNVVEASQ